jgi:hypothetical protein
MTNRFKDETSGAEVEMHLFYGFGDSGSLAGSFAGYPTREAAIVDINKEWPDVVCGTKPEDLGHMAIAVLSGQEFVDELKKRGILDDLGYWLAT